MSLQAILEAKWRLTLAASNVLRLVMDMHGGKPVTVNRMTDLFEDLSAIKQALHEAAVASVRKEPGPGLPQISDQKLATALDQIDEAVKKVTLAELALRAGLAALDRARVVFEQRED